MTNERAAEIKLEVEKRNAPGYVSDGCQKVYGVLELIEDRRKMREALVLVASQVTSGYLVRDITRDSEPGWAMKQIPLVAALQKMASVIAETE